MKQKSVMKLAALLILAALLTYFSACGSESPSTKAPETDTLPETASEWDRATKIWTPNTALPIELRVRPGNFYDLEPDEEGQGCAFLADNGNSYHLLIQGLDYENDFDAMVGFLKGKNPEKLSVGKETKAIVAVYDEENVEIVCKLDDMTCLTIKATDEETVAAFFIDVMIRVDGKDYTPLPENEKYETIV